MAYKTTCPQCDGNNFYISNVMSHCFSPSCGYSEFNNGNNSAHIINKIKSEYIQEIRTLYTDLAKYYHSCIGAREAEYLINRGFTTQTIQDRLIGYCPIGKNPKYRSKVAKEAGIATANNEAFLADRIIFPYFRNKKVVTDLRGRSLDPNEELRYKSPFNPAYYRGAIYPYNYDIAQKAKRIGLTEGEIKADIALQIDFPCIAIPGIGSWREGFIQSEDQEVIIIFDNERDPKIQKEVIAAIQKIIPKLDNPKIALLPLHTNEKKAEIDVFINKYGAALFMSVINSALDYHTWQTLQ